MTTVSNDLDVVLGRRVDALLTLAKVSKKELALRLGKQPGSISHKISNFRGRSFDKWELLEIAEWLHVGVGVLYGTEPMPNRLAHPNAGRPVEPRSPDQQLPATEQYARGVTDSEVQPGDERLFAHTQLVAA